MAKYDEFGREIPDPTPVEMPLGFRHPPTIQEMIQNAVRTEMSRLAQAEGMESFEEADDFEVEEEFDDVTTQYELKEMQEEYIKPAVAKGGDNGGAKVERNENSPGAEGVRRAGGEAASGKGAGPDAVADDSSGKGAVDRKV